MLPVVGVGASAGGLEALSQLLTHLPVDTPMAFVLVQHLDPSHESILAELLSRTTHMPVLEVTHGMRVEPARVYVMPPNTSLTMVEGVLNLAPRSEDRGHMPIDHFLRSLARDCGKRAIGVILSGSASDGALGLKAIKGEGGITFAQDVASAKFDGMPRSAVASGSVDFVLPPREIARELSRIGRHPYLTASDTPTEPPPGGERALDHIFRMLLRETGVDFTQYRQTTIRRRIARRMVVHRIDTLEGYRRYLAVHQPEVQVLYNELLINVTGFFRDPEAFRVLQRSVFPRIIKHRSADAPIRAWTPGCATGEETYSLAITLVESLGPAAGEVPIQIFGTDVRATAVSKARTGVYPASIELDVSAERLRRFFVKLDGQYQVRKSIRELCVFAHHNLAKDPPFAKMDLIACRNVLIYLEAGLQKRVLSIFHYALQPTGFLMVGPAETLGPQSELLWGAVDKAHKIFAKTGTSTRFDMSSAGPDHAPDKTELGRTLSRTGDRADAGSELRREVDRIVLGKYAPASVLINDAMEILEFRGHTSPYLEPAPGQPSLNLLKMAREGLLMVLRSAIDWARKRNVPVRREGLRIKQDGVLGRVNLEIVPVSPRTGERTYLVLFERIMPETKPKTKRGTARGPRRPGQTTDGWQLARLRQELTATKEFLQSIIAEREAANAELQTANEEILSSNEELQSTNEELETAQEELQSVNEELTTVNEELQHRNGELALANNDLRNLFGSVNIAIVMLDRDGRIRRFTAKAAEVLKLVPADVGLPIGDTRPSIDLVDLEGVCSRVIETGTVSECEVRTRDGRWYSLRVGPYKTSDDRIEGAVLTLVDVTTLKTSVEEVTAARDYAEAIVDTVRVPLVVLDGELRVRSASRSFYETFRVSPEQTTNHLIYELGNGQWNIPALRDVLSQVLERDARFEDLEVTHDFPYLGPRTMLLCARHVRRGGKDARLVLLAIEDITTHAERAPAASKVH